MTIFERPPQQILPGAAAAALMALALVACSTPGARPSPDTPASDSESVNTGYTLLHVIVSGQENSDKLLLIKHVSPEVRQIIKQISEATQKIEADLQRFAKEDPHIRLDRSVLPLMEEKQRESATLERGLQLVGTSGKKFERLLLLTQSGLLTTERHIARVMRDAEKDPERKAFWGQAVKTFDELYANLVKLLEDRYFSH